MAGSPDNTESRSRWRAILGIAAAAVVGALLVTGAAFSIGTLLQEQPHPVTIAAFALVGGVFGAFAWGALEHDRRRRARFGHSDAPEAYLTQVQAPSASA